MLMLKSIRLTENMATFVKKRISLWGTMVRDKKVIGRRLRVVDVLDGCDPMRMPMQAVQRCIGSSSANTSGEILPLPSMDGLFIEVVSLAAYGADLFVGKVGSRNIVEEMYAIEGMRLFWVRLVHGRREGRRGLVSRQAGVLIICIKYLHGHRGCDEAGPERTRVHRGALATGRPTLDRAKCTAAHTLTLMGVLQKVVVIGGNGFVGAFSNSPRCSGTPQKLP
jgi:hypothetical protein